MRILQLASHLEVGGITRYVLTLSERLVKHGHHVIVAADEGNLQREVAAIGATHWRVPLHTSAEFSLPVMRAQRQLTIQLQEHPVDLIHAHTRVAQVVADRLSRRFRIPYVTTWHGIFKRRLGRLLWPCTGTCTIAISLPVQQHLLRDFRVPATRMRLIYNGVDTAHYAQVPSAAEIQAFRQRWQIPDNTIRIGGIGRMASGRVKGFDLILVAARLLMEHVPNLHVVLVGDGPRRPFLEDVSRRLGLRDRVHFLGAVGDVRVPLAALDVFVFPSRWPEGFGLTLIEAMAAGRPVIATRTGAVADIVEHQVTGLLVPPERPDEVARGIRLLLQDSALASRLGQAAQRRVHEAFSLDRMTSEVEGVYRDALSHRTSSAR